MARTLLVIDVQRTYFPGGALPLWQADETEARILEAIGNVRAGGGRIVLAQHVSQDGSAPFASDAPGTAIRPAILGAAGNAPIVVKHHADAFQGTDLLTHLHDTSELVICGMMTQNCVVFTAMSDDARPIPRCVVADLCTGPTEAVHRIALTALRSKLRVIAFGERPTTRRW